jgi:hypothetical protein
VSEKDLVEIAVENFMIQPKHLQLVLLQGITVHQNRVIQDIINKLSSLVFEFQLGISVFSSESKGRLSAY